MTARAASLLVLAFLASAAPAVAAHPLCHPGPEAEAVEEAVGTPQEVLELSPEEWRERLALVEAALEERPDDLFLHRQRQDLYTWGPKEIRDREQPGLVEEYAALREEHPDDPRFLYLHARMADDREVQRQAYAAALEADPEFPWGLLGMVSVLVREEREAEKAEGSPPAPEESTLGAEGSATYLARFLETCPDRLHEALTYSRGIEDLAFWQGRLPGFRERMRSAPADHLRALPYLWELDFRLAELSEHAAVRERVAGDLVAVEALGSEEREVLDVLKQGYELAGEAEKAAAIEARLREADPCSRDAVYATISAWADEHPPTEGELPEEERRAMEAAFAEETGRWVERCPDAYSFWGSRLRALDALDDTPPAEVVAAALRVAELYAEFRGWSFPPGYEQAAEVLIGRGLELDRALELLERSETEVMKRREEQAQYRDEYPEEERRQIERSESYADWRRELLVARARIGRGELEPAAGLLAELGARLEALDPKEEAKGREALAHAGYQGSLWEARAELAEAEGRPADAVAYLLRAATAKPAGAPPWLQGPDPDEARERAAELWAGLGGTAEGLAALERAAASPEAAAALADVSPWVEASEPLPAFELADLSGKVWTLAELQGKTVFANAWATWCGPCREELPVVQALHERLADRDDVVVVTLNMDMNPGAIAPYLTKEGFTFPVLLAFDYLQEDAEVFGIPQSWILDGTGTVRFEQSGYDASVAEEVWLAEVEAKLEAAARPAEAGAGSGG
ncbi:MAG TPA: TlpA disulfide reductase family protein [Thermoanaerobaculia bacterium]